MDKYSLLKDIFFGYDKYTQVHTTKKKHLLKSYYVK